MVKLTASGLMRLDQYYKPELQTAPVFQYVESLEVLFFYEFTPSSDSCVSFPSTVSILPCKEPKLLLIMEDWKEILPACKVEGRGGGVQLCFELR